MTCNNCKTEPCICTARPLDERTEWQKRMGVGERQAPPPMGDTRSTTELTHTGCTKETVEHADGRVDNFYTIPTHEVTTTCQLA